MRGFKAHLRTMVKTKRAFMCQRFECMQHMHALPFLHQRYWQSKKQIGCQHSLAWLETWLFEPYHHRFDTYTRLKMSVLQNFEQETCLLSCSTFCGKVMSQNRFRANICVRETAFDSSIQAHWTGDFMSQKRRIYGLSDNSSFRNACQDRPVARCTFFRIPSSLC